MLSTKWLETSCRVSKALDCKIGPLGLEDRYKIEIESYWAKVLERKRDLFEYR